MDRGMRKKLQLSAESFLHKKKIVVDKWTSFQEQTTIRNNRKKLESIL